MPPTPGYLSPSCLGKVLEDIQTRGMRASDQHTAGWAEQQTAGPARSTPESSAPEATRVGQAEARGCGQRERAQCKEEAQRTLNMAQHRLITGSDTLGTRDLQGPTSHNSAFQLASTWHTVKLHSYFLFSFSLHTKFDTLIGCFNLKNSSEGLISPWQPGSPSKRKPSAQPCYLFWLTRHGAEKCGTLSGEDSCPPSEKGGVQPCPPGRPALLLSKACSFHVNKPTAFRPRAAHIFFANTYCDPQAVCTLTMAQRQNQTGIKWLPQGSHPRRPDPGSVLAL